MTRKRIDLTGQRFGRLTVLKRCGTYTYPSGNKRSKWLCKCDCGNICEVKSNSLKSGKKSCGCLEAENHKRFANENRDIDISGQRYGMLTAISKVGVTKSGAAWLCKCECGNERIVSIGDLRRKRYPTIDCGHHSKQRPQRAIDALTKWIRDNDSKDGTRLTTLTSNPRKNGTSKICGVSWRKREKRWVAYLVLRGEYKLHKSFTKKEDAIRARREAEDKYFKPILEKYHRDKE
ncbi:hypothetical protein JK175_01440 [Lacticaseibacillus paracasei]|uniref:hypothetical protein n=1 Tax=Lacticaseibacillus paracasei TaxID=1597 RepID=UPI001BA985AF|nr:hypothetical protein [Lacticaseibacillus paracasei]MBS0990518.1 hypothetical protein [Lacticaseibacillus paracasei]